MTEFTVKKVPVFTVALRQKRLLRNSAQIWTAKRDLSKK